LDLFGTSPQGAARLLGNSSTAQHITSGRGNTARASLGAEHGAPCQRWAANVTVVKYLRDYGNLI